MSGSDGFLLVSKPRGMTSFDVIRSMRRAFNGTKIGHAGTLDPDATGLLICAIGNATRFLAHLATEPKVYRFTLCFGSETDTLDATGSIVEEGGAIPAVEEIDAVLPRFTGTIQQVPPAYSAVKTNGKRAYALARKGGTPELKSREVSVYNLHLLSYDEKGGNACLETACSGGTYVRSMARDIARALGTLGYASGIHRLRCGDFAEEQATVPDGITAQTPLIPIQTALSQYPVWEADERLLADISYGRDITLPQFQDGTQTAVLITGNSRVAALVNRTAENRFHPSIVCSLSDSDGNS